MNHSEMRISLFFQFIFGFWSKKVFLQCLVDILPLGSGSVDPYIFADPDPGSKNLADPDPKHWFKAYRCESGMEGNLKLGRYQGVQ